MKKRCVAWILLVVSIALGIVSYCILPETVVTQLSAGGSGATTMPKLVAIFIPFALGAGGALAMLVSKNEDRAGNKGGIVSAVGIAVFALMLVVNL